MDAVLSVLLVMTLAQGRVWAHVEVINDAANDAATDEDQIPENFRRVIQYLTNFERPEGLTRKKYLQFQRYATGFLLRIYIYDNMLFKRSKPNLPPKRVIWNVEEKNKIIRELHDQNGHRGRQGTNSKVALHYWWPGQYRDVEEFVRTCEACHRNLGRWMKNCILPYIVRYGERSALMWFTCQKMLDLDTLLPSVTEVKGFLGLCIYYRIWIKDFAIRANPLYQLTPLAIIWTWILRSCNIDLDFKEKGGSL